MADKHLHEFKAYKMLNVVADNPAYDMSKHGVWSFVIVECKCKKGVPIAYGKRKEMQAKLKELTEGK